MTYRKVNDKGFDFSTPMNEIDGQGLGVVSVRFNNLGNSKLYVTLPGLGIASSSIDSKIRVYNIESDSDIKEFKQFDMEAMQLWRIDYHPKNEEILYGTMSLNTLSKLIPYLDFANFISLDVEAEESKATREFRTS